MPNKADNMLFIIVYDKRAATNIVKNEGDWKTQPNDYILSGILTNLKYTRLFNTT